MTSLKKTAAAIALASAAAFAAAPASATYYPEYPEPPTYPEYPTNPSNTNNNNNNNSNQNTNKNNNNNSNYNNNDNSNYNSNKNNNNNSNHNNNQNNNNNTQGQSQGQGQAQGQNQGQSQNAYGGAGGQGGQGGKGGSANSNATSNSNSNSHSNATGGAANSNATGGQSNATGGTSNANGGASNSGGNSMSMSNNYEAPKPMGNVAPVTIIPAGNCGEGWALNLSIPFFGAGGGKSSQNQFCLSQEAAKTAINAGLVAKDTGMVATGLASLRNLHPEFDAAANTVVTNLMKPCAAQAAKISAIMLTQNELQCSGEYVTGTENFIRSLQPVAVPAPVVVPVQPIRVEVINPVRVEGTVSTKEVARPAPVRRAAPVAAPKPKDPCGCK